MHKYKIYTQLLDVQKVLLFDMKLGREDKGALVIHVVSDSQHQTTTLPSQFTRKPHKLLPQIPLSLMISCVNYPLSLRRSLSLHILRLITLLILKLFTYLFVGNSTALGKGWGVFGPALLLLSTALVSSTKYSTEIKFKTFSTRRSRKRILSLKKRTLI